MDIKKSVGKIAYGSIFMLFLPVLCVIWARQTESFITLPVPNLPWVAFLCMALGSLVMTWAMADLWFKGQGLPMNAFPPAKFVNQGAYRWLEHPIYVAASLLCVGCSLWWQSRSGFWLVSPVLTLSWIALVWGFENEDILRRFPARQKATFWFSLPPNNSEKPHSWSVFAVYVLVLLTWLIGYELLIFIGTEGYISTYFAFEKDFPVIEWTELFYVTCYVYVSAVPLVLRTNQTIRNFMVEGWLLSSIGLCLQFILPFASPHKPFIVTNFWGELLAWEQSLDGAGAAFPSFHVLWTLLAARYYNAVFSNKKLIINTIAFLICASCWTTGMHSLADLVAALVLFIAVINRTLLWYQLKNYLERTANSWHAIQIGQLRIINHSIYAFFSAFIGILVLCLLLQNIYLVLFVSFIALFGAGVYAQIVEGHSGLSRPFGYYGSIIFGLIACLLGSYIFNVSFLLIVAAFALISPAVQGIGRFRCVVQGCCHGKITTPLIGIRVHHPKSRVCALSHLTNQPIHLTPLYSMLSNLLIGMLLWRLWYAGVAVHLLGGLYFILSGISRFVEEFYRGEVQTTIVGKLRLYQWFALGSVLVGILLTCLPMPIATFPPMVWQHEFLGVAFDYALLASFSMGMDFPNSNWRFSRLAK